MHQTRSEINRALPLARKGTKYIARALRNNSNSVPLVVAIRDMLKLATTSKEVKGMIHNKKIKINGKIAKNLKDPVCVFSTLTADKTYLLNILPTGRFEFKETSEKDRRLKIIGKKTVKKGNIQYALHDGTNVLSEKNFSVGDTLILNNENKIIKHIGLDKGKEVFAISGTYIGRAGKIEAVSNNKITVRFDKENVVLDTAQIIAIWII